MRFAWMSTELPGATCSGCFEPSTSTIIAFPGIAFPD
jgi:hypothetical protein